MPADAPAWAHAFARSIEAVLNVNERPRRPVPLPQYPSTGLPSAADWTGHLIFVTTTNRTAYSDGTNWRYQSDEATV